MPALDGSRSVLSADANYSATDWAQARGGAQLDIKATAELKRGIDLELGASALVSLDAAISKFLVADLRGQASASARVRAQVQVPLDLFEEVGFAVRLQAAAEASAGVELGIGLNIGDFLALAGEDPRMKGVALRLLRVLLEEAEIKGGVLAKASAAAMAYANLSATGTLIGDRPGFLVAAEAGVGLKAGAGFRVFGGFGIAQPQRLIRRTVDAVVDETLARIGDGTRDAVVLLALDELRAPAKMALRTAFEVGAELARQGHFDPAAGPVLAQRCLQVMLEEAQRYLLGKLADIGLTRFKEQLVSLGFARNVWDAAAAQREALAAKLEAIPEDPFESDDENKAYWRDVFVRGTALAVALGAQNAAAASWVEGLAVTWAAVQLSLRASQRISSSGARAALLSAVADTTFPPFGGDPIDPAPPMIAAHIEGKLRPAGPSRALTERDLVAFLLDKALADALVAQVPSARAVLDIVGGVGSAHVDALTTVLQNLGAFVPAGGGRVDPAASLRVVIDGLASYVNTRLRSDVEPAIRQALAGAAPELSLYFDEVLLDTLGFAMNTIHTRVLAWAIGDQQGHTALREACSAVVMRIFGRSLVAATDVLMAKAMAEVSDGFRRAAPELNRRGGVVDHLVSVVPIDRALLRDAVTEVFDIASDVFAPLPAHKRARLRELMYRVMDTAPQGGADALAVSLRNDMLVPNAEAATELVLELGGLIADNFIRLVNRILSLILEAIFQLIEDTLRSIEAKITEWIADLQAFVQELAVMIAEVARAIAQLGAQLADATDRLLDRAQALLGVLSDRRNTLRTALLDMALDTSRGLLSNVPGYSALPSSQRDAVEGMLRAAIHEVLDQRLIDDVEDLLEGLAGGASQFLSEVRDIDASDDVVGAIIELLADTVEDALRASFGSHITIPIDFRARGTFRGPRIDTPWGSYRPEISHDFRVDLGSVRIDINDIVGAVRAVVRTIGAVNGAANALAAEVVAMLDLENRLHQKETEEANHRARDAESRRRITETQASAASAVIVSPGAGAAYPGVVPVEIVLTGVPLSFLGEAEGEPPRLHLFLNDLPLDLARFAAESRDNARADADVLPGLSRLHPIVRERMVQHLSLAGGPLKHGGRGVASVKTKVAFAAHTPKNLARTSQGLGSLAPDAHSRPAAIAGRQIRIGEKMFVQRGATTLGRRPNIALRADLLLSAVPGLVLRGTLPIDELRDGFNTLSVVLANGNAMARVTESVVFLASDRARIRPPSSVVGSSARAVFPVANNLDPALLAPALRDEAVARAARQARVGPPPAGAKRLAFERIHPASPEEAQGALREAHQALTARVTAKTRETRTLRERLHPREDKGIKA